ncbi:MAG TPA: fatty acid desaturase [Fluviicola sp.]|nr:fatty acid desaturase [Fluviicola sp.]
MQDLPLYKSDEQRFYATLTERVNAYFTDKGISKYATTAWYVRAVLMVSLFCATVVAIYLQWFNNYVNLALCFLAGLLMAGIGLAISHQASHNTISEKQWVNRLWSLSFNLVGVSDYIWHIKHDVFHHAYTNIYAYDEALKEGDILRFSTDAPLKKMHRFQHVYAVLIYGVFTIFWIFILDFEKLFRYRRNGIGKERHHSLAEHLIFWTTKIYYVAVFVYLPLVIGYEWWQVLIGHLVMHAVAGTIVTHALQVEHLNEKTIMIPYQPKEKQEMSWAENQLVGTANFAIKNPLLNWYIAGVNLQIEHHLFQYINAAHYENLAPIVRQTAEEFNYPYVEFSGIGEAVRSHYRFLKRLGRN